jgi:uncharacterized protein GlcG (DUF336 family)
MASTTTSQGTVSLEDARRVIEAGEETANEIGQPQNIAVVDAGGNLVSHIRMDGAWIGSVDIAINKAFTARRRVLRDPAVQRRTRGDPPRRYPAQARRQGRRRGRRQWR